MDSGNRPAEADAEKSFRYGSAKSSSDAWLKESTCLLGFAGAYSLRFAFHLDSVQSRNNFNPLQAETFVFLWNRHIGRTISRKSLRLRPATKDIQTRFYSAPAMFTARHIRHSWPVLQSLCAGFIRVLLPLGCRSLILHVGLPPLREAPGRDRIKVSLILCRLWRSIRFLGIFVNGQLTPSHCCGDCIIWRGIPD